MNHTIPLPMAVCTILSRLQAKGFKAYVVGGCVRDCLMQLTPKDWDVTTNALPSQVKALFPKTFDTGIKHGTITVLMDRQPFEVTTFRTEGIYTDYRRPDEVFFTDEITDDLMRRDFTMNAIAYNEAEGLIDPYNGKVDIQNRVIRGVGDPAVRFQEDPLRMLRAVRFSAVLGFFIDPVTGEALAKNAALLKKISAERIRMEMDGILCSRGCTKLLEDYGELLVQTFFLGYTKMVSPHKDTVSRRMSQMDNHIVLRLTAFLSTCQSDVVTEYLRKLKYDNQTMKLVEKLHAIKDVAPTDTEAKTRRFLSDWGGELFGLFCRYHKAVVGEAATDAMEQFAQKITARGDCLSIGDLDINGNDLMELGIYGKQIGVVLKELLLNVLDTPQLNTKDTLLKLAENSQK